MVASAVFITDLQGKAIISRNYRGDVPLNKVIEQFSKFLTEVEDEAKTPVFHVDTNGDISAGDDVGANGVGGEHFVYVAVSTADTGNTKYPLLSNDPQYTLSSSLTMTILSHFQTLCLASSTMLIHYISTMLTTLCCPDSIQTFTYVQSQQRIPTLP